MAANHLPRVSGAVSPSPLVAPPTPVWPPRTTSTSFRMERTVRARHIHEEVTRPVMQHVRWSQWWHFQVSPRHRSSHREGLLPISIYLCICLVQDFLHMSALYILLINWFKINILCYEQILLMYLSQICGLKGPSAIWRWYHENHGELTRPAFISAFIDLYGQYLRWASTAPGGWWREAWFGYSLCLPYIWSVDFLLQYRYHIMNTLYLFTCIVFCSTILTELTLHCKFLMNLSLYIVT